MSLKSCCDCCGKDLKRSEKYLWIDFVIGKRFKGTRPKRRWEFCTLGCMLTKVTQEIEEATKELA